MRRTSSILGLGQIPGAASILAVTAAAVLAACGDDAEAGGGRPGGNGPGAQAIPVETDTVRLGRIARVVTIPGTVDAIRTVGVNAQVSGAVLSVPVEEGDRVEEGQIVARLDDRVLRAQLRNAEAGFEVAEGAFQRARELRDRQIITAAEYEQDRTAYEAALAQLEELRTRVGFTEVRAPLGGVVTSKSVQAGDVVGNQARLVEVAEVDTMVVRVSVSEREVVEIAPGDEVQVRLDALPDRTLTGTVRRVFPAADATTRLVPVEVMLAPDERQLARPGFLARVVFELDPKEDATLVAAAALVSRGGGEAVYLVDDSTVVLRSVTPGLTAEGEVEITDGLVVGDRVVTAGSNLLRDGATIRDVSRERSAEGGESSPAPPPEGGRARPEGGP